MLVLLIGPSARIIMMNVEYDIPHQLNAEVDWLALWRKIVEERALRRQYNHDSTAGDPWSQKTDQFLSILLNKSFHKFQKILPT